MFRVPKDGGSSVEKATNRISVEIGRDLSNLASSSNTATPLALSSAPRVSGAVS
jgi:hypothetical protein